jgi:hypothetical protein
MPPQSPTRRWAKNFTMNTCLLRLVFLGSCLTSLLTAAETLSPAEEGRRLAERIKLGQQIVRLELSPQVLEALFLQPLKAVLEKLESKSETESLAKEIRESVTKLASKVVTEGKLWDEVAADYASNFSHEELEELAALVRNPVLLKRDIRRGDLMIGVRFRLDEYAPQEAREVRRLINQVLK